MFNSISVHDSGRAAVRAAALTPEATIESLGNERDPTTKRLTRCRVPGITENPLLEPEMGRERYRHLR